MLSSEGSDGENIPAFLIKLWKLVEDPMTNELILWSQSGRSFIIKDPSLFTQALLPVYFKHRNMASFIRQLNMYGFRKVPSLETGGLLGETGEVEFSHPKFIQGRKGLIQEIKRKVQSQKSVTLTKDNAFFANEVLSEIQAVKKNQDRVGKQLMVLKKDNALLWRENAMIRQRFQKQQQIIEKLVHFLLTMVKPTSQPIGPKRKYNRLALEGADILDLEGSSSSASLMGQDTPSIEFSSTSRLPSFPGPVIHEMNSDQSGDPIALEKVIEEVGLADDVDQGPSSYSLDSPSLSNNFDLLQSNVKQSSFSKDKTKSSLGGKYLTDDHEVLNIDPQQKYTISSKNGTLILEPLPSSAGQKQNVVMSSSQMQPPLDLAVSEPAFVHSPNGTILQNKEFDEQLSPDLMRMVNISEVNPNIVIPGAHTQFAVAEPDDGINMQKNSKGSQKVGRKKIGKKGMQLSEGGNIFTDKNVGAELAIPEKSLGNEDMSKFIDDFESYLGNLHGKLKSSKMGNVDSSLLLSIFGNDFRDPDYAVPPHVSGKPVSGNELLVYDSPALNEELETSSLNQDMEDDFTLGSLISDYETTSGTLGRSLAPSKKLKTANTKGNGKNLIQEDTDILNTPSTDLDIYKLFSDYI